MRIAMSLTYHAIQETDADYEALIDISNTESDVPRSVEDIRLQDSLRKPNDFRHREFVLLDGKRIGMASCIEQSMSDVVGGHYLGLSLLPEYRDIGFEAPIYEHLLHVSESNGGRTATAYVRDDRKGRNEVLQQLGFQCIMRDPTTQLDLDEFDPGRFASTLREVERKGIVLRSIADLVSEGVDWLASAHELTYELIQDVPLPEPPRRFTLEEFRAWRTDASHWFPEGWIAAFDGDRWVGTSDLAPYPAKRDVAMTGLTGVVRTHRRRGIASALKVRALEGAKRGDVRYVRTGNEEHNPMLQLNLRLGFREVYAILVYRREI